MTRTAEFYQAAAASMGAAERARLISNLAGYAETDLVCYRTSEDSVLAERQREGWDPWLLWLEQTHGAVLRSTSGIVPVPQDGAALFRLRQVVEAQEDLRLLLLHEATVLLGSLVLALALMDGALAAEEAHRLARLDDARQAERWGEDEEMQAKAGSVWKELQALASAMECCRGGI